MESVSAVLDKLEDAIDQALLLNDPGDPVAQFLVANGTFITGANQPATITIDVPHDADFFCESFMLLLSARLLNQTGLTTTATDITFRPARWVCTCNSPPNAAFDFTPAVQDANGSWTLSDSYNGSYLGKGSAVMAAAYSARYGQGTVNFEAPWSAWPGAHRFHVPQRIKAGSTITMGHQPTFSRVHNATQLTEFQVELMMAGHKVFRRPA